MKRIIDGKRYDTDTATYIGKSKGFNVKWDVYRTQKGNWFLVGAGKSIPYETPKLLPMNTETAIECLERSGLYDVIEQYFDVEDA